MARRRVTALVTAIVRRPVGHAARTRFTVSAYLADHHLFDVELENIDAEAPAKIGDRWKVTFEPEEGSA